MSTIVIDTSQPRSLRSLVVAAGADTWQPVFGVQGPAFRIPSQTHPGVVHTASETTCTCRDSRGGFVCKHRLAVQLHNALRLAAKLVPA